MTRAGGLASLEARRGVDARVLVCSIIVAALVFFLSTVREGHVWGDDFGLYILHAKNLAEGATYRETGYIFNPAYPAIGPQTYPPVFPLLLAAVYEFFGMNLTAMKVLVILTFMLSLPIIFLLFRDDLPGPYPVALVAMLAFSPSVWDFKDSVVSDLPFLLVVYAGLLLIQRAYRPENVNQKRTRDVFLLAATIYLAYGTRSLGFLLLPCLWICDLIRFRRLTAFTVKVTGVAGVAIIAQNLFFHSDRSYLVAFGVGTGSDATRLRLVLGASLNNLLEYARAFSDFLENGYSKILRVALSLSISGLAIAGYVARVRNKITQNEIFAALYLAAIVVTPISGGTRYLFPLLPLCFFYAFRGVQAVCRREEVQSRVFVLMVGVILAVYAARYTTQDFGPIREGLAKSETRQLFDYLKTNTSNDDVLIFRKPRAIAFATGRKSAAAHQPTDDHELWSYFRQIRGTHLILGPEDLDRDYYAYFRRFVGHYPGQLREVYANTDFKVYRITGSLSRAVDLPH